MQHPTHIPTKPTFTNCSSFQPDPYSGMSKILTMDDIKRNYKRYQNFRKISFFDTKKLKKCGIKGKLMVINEK